MPKIRRLISATTPGLNTTLPLLVEVKIHSAVRVADDNAADGLDNTRLSLCLYQFLQYYS